MTKQELNQTHNENCLDTMARMPNGLIDLTVTSPPYDNLRDYNGYSFDFEAIAKELYRVTKDGGVVVWVVGDSTVKGSESGTSFRQALYFKEIGFNLHDTMIYQKHNFSNPSSNRYHQIFEFMFVLSRGKPATFNPIKDRRNIEANKVGSWGKNTSRQQDGSFVERAKKVNTEFGMRYNIWRIKTEMRPLHPAPFPEQLANDHIITWSNESDIVYDPFMGSGTTAKMAVLNNRNYIGSEISEGYVDICTKRLSAIREAQDD
jgi:site-specific DNA-methyltransferase (adenine-specific)